MNTSTKLTIRWILAMQTLNVIVNVGSLIYRFTINNSFAAFRFEQIQENLTFLFDMMILLGYFYFMFKLRQVQIALNLTAETPD